jgi:hypothetical protein
MAVTSVKSQRMDYARSYLYGMFTPEFKAQRRG